MKKKNKDKNNNYEQVRNGLSNVLNSLFAKQEVGKPFYIIDHIENNICKCDIFAAPNSFNQATPVLFLDKNLAKKTAKLINDGREVTGLTNYYFNFLYFKAPMECLIASDMNGNGQLLLHPYTIDEIRADHNLKTTEELTAMYSK